MIAGRWAPALLLLALALSGCSGDGGEGGESSTTSSSEGETASATATTTSRSSATATASASSATTGSSTSTTGPAGNGTGNQTGSQTTGLDQLVFVGTGEEMVMGTPTAPAAPGDLPFVNLYTMDAVGGGGLTTLHTFGSWTPDAHHSPVCPTFTYDGSAGPVTIADKATVFMFLSHRLGGVAGSYVAQVFGPGAEILGPEGGVQGAVAAQYPGISEVPFEFKIPGTYATLEVQVCITFVDSGAPGGEMYWGDGAHNSRIVFS